MLLHPRHVPFITVEGVPTLVVRQVHGCLVLWLHYQQGLPLHLPLLQPLRRWCSRGFIVVPTDQTAQVDATLHSSRLTGSGFSGTTPIPGDQAWRAPRWPHKQKLSQECLPTPTQTQGTLKTVFRILWAIVLFLTKFKRSVSKKAFTKLFSINTHIECCPFHQYFTHTSSHVSWDPFANTIFSLSASSCSVRRICSPKRRIFSFFRFCLSMSLITPARSL